MSSNSCKKGLIIELINQISSPKYLECLLKCQVVSDFLCLNYFPSGHFTRYGPALSLYIEFGSSDGDVFPPSRIFDLSLAEKNIREGMYSNNSMEVSLTWTSPGGDYNSGAATRYIIIGYIQ